MSPTPSGGRRGNVMARMRMITLFDLAAKHRGFRLARATRRSGCSATSPGTPTTPRRSTRSAICSRRKCWALARHLGVPDVIVGKPPTADLVVGQTDEGDFGISYAKADEILNWLLSGYSPEELGARGFDAADVAIVQKRVESTHWKRRLPTVAMISPTAIGEIVFAAGGLLTAA